MDITEALKKATYPRDYRKQTTPASINPAIALVMNQLAGLDDSDKILDPCCGSATILIERLIQKKALCVGIDIDPRQIENAKQNSNAAGFDWQDSGQAGMTEQKITLLHGNITEKKFPEGFFTKIISNLPYGIHSGSREQNVKLYHFLADISSTWLKKDGKAVFLTSSKNLLRNSFEFNKQMALIDEIEIPNDTLNRAIFIYQRTATNSDETTDNSG